MNHRSVGVTWDVIGWGVVCAGSRDSLDQSQRTVKTPTCTLLIKAAVTILQLQLFAALENNAIHLYINDFISFALHCFRSAVCWCLIYFAGRELDVTKSLNDYSFANDQQSGILGQNLTNLVFVRRQIGGFTSLSPFLDITRFDGHSAA